MNLATNFFNGASMLAVFPASAFVQSTQSADSNVLNEAMLRPAIGKKMSKSFRHPFMLRPMSVRTTSRDNTRYGGLRLVVLCWCYLLVHASVFLSRSPFALNSLAWTGRNVSMLVAASRPRAYTLKTANF